MYRNSKISLIVCVIFLMGLSNFSIAQIAEDESALLQEGIDFFKSGDYDNAIESLNKAINISVDKNILFRANLYLGYTHYSLESRIEAAKYVEWAIEYKPNMELNKDEYIPDFIDFVQEIKSGLVGLVFIESLPSNAMVFLDKVKYGETPFKREFLAKKYDLKLVKPGYDAFYIELDVFSNEPNNKTFDLSEVRNWKKFLRSGLVMIALGLTMSLL